MANGLLDTLRTGALAFAGGTPRSGIVREEETRRLLSGIQEASAQPGFNAASNPLLAQLQAVSPTVGGQVAENFESLSSSRRKAMFQDALETKRLLAIGKPELALQRLDNRLGAGAGIPGANMADTQGIRDLIAQGTPESLAQAQQEIDAFIDVGVATKELDRPQLNAETVQSSQILDDGSVIAIMRDGSTRVTNPTGEEVTGKAARDAIATAARFGVDIKAESERATKQAAQGVKLSETAFNKLPSIRTAILNIDKAIDAIDSGASTGAITRFLPSVRESSIRLDNLRSQMGLDIIGGTTFGALSESELEFALDTALPESLEPQDLKTWLLDKRSSQSKVADALREQAVFFGAGGTIEELITKQQEARASSPEVTSQAEFDALPSGATYTENGVLFRKP